MGQAGQEGRIPLSADVYKAGSGMCISYSDSSL